MTAFSRNNQLDIRSTEPQPLPEGQRRNPLQVIWLRRWIVVITLILAMGVGAIQYYRTTPMYQSKARVYVAQNAPKLMAADAASVMTATNNYLWTQCELICSPNVLEKVAQRPDISILKTFQAGEDAGRSSANIVGYLRSVVSAQPGRRDDIISVFVKSPYMDDAPRIANAIV